jgi:hypothetical protein
MDPIETINADTAAELFERLNGFSRANIFRGQRDADWTLSSTLARHYDAAFYPNFTSSQIDQMLNRFLVYTKGIGLDPPYDYENDNRHARLEFARHYGVPSPLIDFTYSPYVAALFAFSGLSAKQSKSDKRAAIYCLNVPETAGLWVRQVTPKDPTETYGARLTKEQNRFENDVGPLFKDKYPANTLKFVPYPASWNLRMRRQAGCFLYDSMNYKQFGKTGIDDFLALPQAPVDPPENRPPALTKITVPHKIVSDVLQHLDVTGFSVTHLYNSYEGAAIDASDDYYFTRRSGQVWDMRPFPASRDPS